jgi:hypothetical protein
VGKVKWGNNDLADAIEEAQESEFDEYTGEQPPRGVYRFKITRLLNGTSKNGFPELVVFMRLDPDRPAHKEFEGYTMIDFIIVKEDGSTGWRVKPFLRAIGVTPRQFVQNTIEDSEADPADDRFGGGQPITKIGAVKFPGKLVYGAIRPDPKSESGYWKIKYLAPPDNAGSADAAGSGDSGDEDPPF